MPGRVRLGEPGRRRHQHARGCPVVVRGVRAIDQGHALIDVGNDRVTARRRTPDREHGRPRVLLPALQACDRDALPQQQPPQGIDIPIGGHERGIARQLAQVLGFFSKRDQRQQRLGPGQLVEPKIIAQGRQLVEH